MHRRVKKVERAFSLKSRRKSSLNELPRPRFEFEDTLVTQLRGTDILSNCYDVYVDSEINLDFTKDHSAKRATIKKHPFHNDSCLLPVWQAFYNLDKRGAGTVLLGRLLTLISLIGNLLNPSSLTENSAREHFMGAAHVTFSSFKIFIEHSMSLNALASLIDWKRVRAVCWSQCENKYLQALPFDLTDGNLPQEFSHSVYWLWCSFNEVAESDTYPPGMDYEEVELLLRKLFSSLGIMWENCDDNISSVSSSSFLPSQSHAQERSDDARNSSSISEIEYEESLVPTTETLRITFQQFLSIIYDMLGSETILSPSFGRAVAQVYLSEVEEIIKTGWMHLKKPGTDVWKKRWVVLRHQSLEFYSDTLCKPMKYRIVLNHKMHIESLPDTSAHKNRFRLVEREGDFNIAWEAEMNCADTQHSYSWMLIIDLSIKINPTGLSAKKIELAERRLERHRRRESERSAIEKKREVTKAFEKLQDVRQRWNIMQEKLNERATARNHAMDIIRKMDEIYDKLQNISRKEAILRKADLKMRNAFLDVSSGSGVEVTKDERNFYKTVDGKLLNREEKMNSLDIEKNKLQVELVKLQAVSMHTSDSDETLFLVYGSEKEEDIHHESFERQRSASLAVPHFVSRTSQRNQARSYNKGPSLLAQTGNVPTISTSTSALAGSSHSSTHPFLKINASFSQSHPELRNESIDFENSKLHQKAKNGTLPLVDSDALSEVIHYKLVV